MPQPARAVQPLDPTRLGAAIQFRQDFFNLQATLKEEARIRRASAQAKMQRLSRAFTRMANNVEKRQRNLHNAVAAYYVLSRDQQSWSPLTGSTLTAPQYIALNSGIRKDSHIVNDGIKQYENLRHALAEVGDELQEFNEETTQSIVQSIIADWRGISLPKGYMAEQQTKRLLEERGLPEYAEQAVLNAQEAATQYERRQTLSGFAPPPPMDSYDEDSPFYTKPPQQAELPVAAPHNTKLEQPANFAFIKQVPVNAPLLSPAKGNVVHAGNIRGLGDVIIIEHENNLYSVFGHLGTMEVRERDTVQPGQVIGRAGFISNIHKPGIYYHVRKGRDQVSTSTLIKSSDEVIGK